MKVFLDGKFVNEKEALTPIYEPGFIYSQGLFETMRADNNKIFGLEAHLERLIKSAPLIRLNLTYSKEKLKDIISEALSFNNYPSTYLRLTVWQGVVKVHISVIARRHELYNSKEKYISGFSAIISNMRQNETSFLSNLKVSARLHFLLAELEARDKNADEAILLNTKGMISEASRANIFIVKDNVIFTSHKESGCLLGLTRVMVLDIARKEKIRAYEKEIAPGELFDADEAFLTNSLSGIMPLTLVDNKKISQGKTGGLTEGFLKKYQELKG
ncbi:MAG: aminotransferase class IV [Candidatus Omnitrophota bacterium]|nr:aminotransferase class IV [Candidatus Omnitrophota bacterium]